MDHQRRFFTSRLGKKMITNLDRAEWARTGLINFAFETGQDESGDLKFGISAVITDLICDLFHLCDVESLDAELIAKNAMENYIEEVNNQG